MALFLSISIALSPLSGLAVESTYQPVEVQPGQSGSAQPRQSGSAQPRRPGQKKRQRGPPKPQMSMQERMARRAFLDDLRDRVMTFMDQNMVKLTDLSTCLAVKPDHLNCDELIRIVRNNIAKLYPLMRNQLLLISLLDSHTHQLLMDAFQLSSHRVGAKSSGRKIGVYIDSNILANPIEAIWSYDYIPNTPFSHEEIEIALNADSSTIKGSLYPENLSSYEKIYCESVYGAKQVGCNSMKLEYSREKRALQYVDFPLPSEWQGANILQVVQRLTMETHPLQKRAQELAKKKFFEIIQANPYVALMPSAHPSDLEILKAIALMHDKAQETLADFEKRMIKLDDQDVSDKELTKLMEYGPVVASVLEEPGYYMSLVEFDYNSIYEEVSEQYASDELFRTSGHIALLIGFNMLACWGGGRAVKYLTTARKIIKLRRWHELFNPLCFSLTAIPVNGWFIYDSMNDYHQTYKEVFSSVDGKHYIREVNALDAAQRSVFWSILMAPLGVGYVTKYAALEGLGFSKEFLKHLTNKGLLK